MHKTFIIGSIFNIPLHPKTAIAFKNNIDNLYSSLCYFIVYYYKLVM